MNLRKLRLQMRALISLSAALSLGSFLHGAPVNSVVIVRATPNPVVQGQNATIIAGVNVNASVEATGTITVTDTCQTASGPVSTTLGSFPLGSATSPNPGSGFIVVSNFPCLGANQIVASYPGDAVYAPGTSATVTLTVLNQFTATSASLASSGSPVTVGQSVTFTSQLTYSITNNTFPTGTVTFTDTNTNTVLGTGTVTTSGGPRETTTYATLTVALAAGSYAVQASYSGDNIYSPSQSQIFNQVVQQQMTFQTATTLSSSASEVVAGSPITFASQVASVIGIPDGAVSFYDGTTLLATINLDATGQASFTTSALAVGSHSITAAYGGSANYAASTSQAVNVLIDPMALMPTTTSLAASANPITADNPLTLSATVSAASGSPTGTVTFQDVTTTPGVTLGTVTLQNGVASFTLSVTPGNYQYSATYSGDANFSSSVGTLAEIVNPAPGPPSPISTTTTITSSANPSMVGQPVSFTTTVSGADSGIPTGSVTFNVGSTMATVSLDNTGTAVFTTSSLPVGSASVSAAYSGDNNYSGSMSPTLVQAVLGISSWGATPSAGPIKISTNSWGTAPSRSGPGLVTAKGNQF